MFFFGREEKGRCDPTHCVWSSRERGKGGKFPDRSSLGIISFESSNLVVLETKTKTDIKKSMCT